MNRKLHIIPWRGKAYPLQDSGLENSTDCRVHGVTMSQTRLSDFHFHIMIKKERNIL